MPTVTGASGLFAFPRLLASATAGPDPVLLWAAYQAAQAAADTAWGQWAEVKRAGGLPWSGNLYSQAYQLQMTAENARLAYVAALQGADPGARG